MPGATLQQVAAGSGTPTHIDLTAVPVSATPGGTFSTTPKVRVLDVDNNVVNSSTAVTLSLTPVGSELSGVLTCTSLSVTPTEGESLFPGCKISHGGNYHVVATLGTLTDSMDVFVSGPAKVVFSGQPGGGETGTAWEHQPVIKVVDGNDVTVDLDTELGLVIKPGTGTSGAILTCTEVGKKTAADTGVATFHGCAIDKPGTGYRLYGIDIENHVYGTSDVFNVTAGAADHLTFVQQPSGGAGGTALPGQPVVAVQDAAGNTLIGNDDAITLALTTPAGATLTCPAVDAIDGVATFVGCAIDKAGTYTLTATDSTASKTQVSASFDIGAGAATGLAFTSQPSGGAVGASFATQPVLSLTDAGGNPHPGSVTLSLTGGTAGAVLSCAINPQSAGAVGAVFTGCTVDKPGTSYRVHAVSGALTADSHTFDVSVGGAASLEFTQSPGNSFGGSSFANQPQVTVRDAGGNLAGGSVTLALTPNTGTPGAALDCTSQMVSASSGIAAFSGCDVDLAGTGYSLTATSGTVHTTSARFNVTTGSAARIRFTRQPGDGTGGSALSRQPVVEVQDVGGNAITGSTAEVQLAIVSGTGSGKLTCTSNPLPVTRGAAVFQGCRIDRTASAYRLVATAGGFTATSDTFAVTAGPATRLLFTAQPASATEGQAFGTAPTVRVADAGGNAVPGASSITLALTPGTGAAGAQLSCSNLTLSAGGDGIATFPGCSINRAAGGYTLTATGSGLSAESPSFPVVLPPPAPLEQAPTGVPTAQTFGGRHYANNPTSVVDHVNSATGGLLYDTTDLTVAGIGVPLNLTRTYNSLDTSVGAFGQGWSSVLDAGVTFNAGGTTATVRGEDGQRVVFTLSPATNGWVAPPGARSSLKCSAKLCTVTRFDGMRFDVNGTQLLDFYEANGQGLTFTYTAGKMSGIRLSTTGNVNRTVAVTTNAAGRVTKVQQGSRSVSYGYTGNGLSTFTDARGNEWKYLYGTAGLTTLRDPSGQDRLVVTYAGARVASLQAKGSSRHISDTFSYDAGTQTATRTALTSVDGDLVGADYVDTYKGNALVRQVLPQGAILRYSYDSQVNLVEVQDPHGWVQVSTFSPANDLIAQSTPISSTSASVVRFTYDNSHRMVSQTDPNGNTTVYVYNGPNLGGITPPGAGSIATKLNYNTAGLVTSLTNANGRQTFSYDSFGNRTVTISETLPGTVLNGLGSLSTYDEAGHVTSFVDARGTTRRQVNDFKSTWTYDANGNLTGSTSPTGNASNSYDVAGDVTSSTVGGQTSTFAWNEGALRKTTGTPAGLLVQTFDPSGNLLLEEAAGGGTTEHRYDSVGREITTINPAGLVTHFGYDGVGNVTDIDDSAGISIQRQFDSRGRLVRTVSNGAATSSTYDRVGNVTSYRDPGGALTTRTYDSHNNIASVTDAAGTTSYGYDRADNVVTRTDGNGHVTTFSYDGLSRMTSQTTAGHKTSYAYDETGNLVRTTDPDGRTTSLTLDAANRTTRTVYAQSGTATITVDQTWNALGRRTSMTDSTGTHSYGYDSAGRMLTGDGFTYAYDNADGSITETYPDGTHVSYTQDDAGRIMGLTSGTKGNSNYVQASYLRDTNRRTTGIAYSNGVLTTRANDLQGNVLSDSLQRGGTSLATDAYGYDAAGNRTAHVQTAAGKKTTSTYGYDGANRLTKFTSGSVLAAVPALATPQDPSAPGNLVAGGIAPPANTPAVPLPASLPAAAPAYGYDAVGNRTSTSVGGNKTYNHDAFDQSVSESGGVTRTYDGAGDLTRTTGPSRTQTFTYDAARRLTKVVTTGAGASTVDYTYDGDGNRLTKKLGGVTTDYTWDPFGGIPQLVRESVGSTTVRRYFNGDGPVAMQTQGATYFFHLDPLGSVVELSDADGNVVAGYTYDGFGQVTTNGAGAPQNPMLFQGQYLDETTGLYNMRARNYDPSTGRFTQREPLPAMTGVPLVSAYAFVNNRPTVFTDPTGFSAAEDKAFHGQATENGDIAQDTRYAATGALLAVKAVGKVGGFAAAANAAQAEGAVATTASKVGTGLKVAGVGLAVIGLALQTYITIDTCMNGTVQACVGAAVGTAISVGFFVLCTVATEGIGAVGCALAGAVISAGLQYIITEFGPQIVEGLIAFGNLTAEAFTEGAQIVGQALTDFGNDVANSFVALAGQIVSGFNDGLAAVTSGFEDAMQTLVDAGYTVVELANVLADTFAQGAQQAIQGLIDLGYALADVATVLVEVFDALAEDAAQLLKDSFDYTTAQIGAFLHDLYDLTEQAEAAILKGIGTAVQEVATFLQDTYAMGAAAIASVLKDIAYGVEQIGAALKDALAQTSQFIANTLKALSYTVLQVGAVLRDVLNEAVAAAATILKQALYLATDVANALKSAYAAGAQLAAQLLKNVGFLVTEVGQALKDAFAATAQVMAQVLKNVAFAVELVGTALKEVFAQAAEAAATVLRNIGYAATAVANALKTAFTELAQGAAQILENIGFVVNEVAAALSSAFTLGAQAVATVLKAIGDTINEISAALNQVLGQAIEAAAQILKNINYAIAEIAGALQSVFGQAAAAAAEILENIGYLLEDVGAVLRSVFNVAAELAGQILKDLGATATEIAHVLENAFGMAADAIANLLSEALGFAANLISDIGDAFSDFGDAVGDFFSDLF